MRRAGFFIRHFWVLQNAPFLSYLCPCRLKRAQINELIYIYINIFILRCRIEPKLTENLYRWLKINCLYCAIDCTVFIWGKNV